MELTKEYIEENVLLADTWSNEDPEASHGLLYVDIEATGTFEKEADRIRSKNGIRPMFYGTDRDLEGWYEFGIYTSREKILKMTFTPENTEQEDCGVEYEISLEEWTKALIHSRLVDLFGIDTWEKAFERMAK